MASKNLVLITGATGHVGSATLAHLLRAGYRVRAAVRSEAKGSAILARPDIQMLNPGPRLTFTIVPDITALGAYDEAVRDVTHVIHIASPLSTGERVPLDQHNAYFIHPAVQGTLNMLEAAESCGTVRRVVITSSIVALIPVSELEGTAPRDSCRPVKPTDRVAFTEGPYHSDFAAYAASKVAALHHSEAWVERVRPAFDVVYLHPSFVIGHHYAASTPGQVMKGTNSVVLAMLLGKSFGPLLGATVHIEDVARVHVESLDPSVLGNQSYILSQSASWNDAKQIARQEFPEALETRLLVGNGNVESTLIPIDSSETESTFGFRFASFDEQVRSTVSQFLQLHLEKKGPSLDVSLLSLQKRVQMPINVRATA